MTPIRFWLAALTLVCLLSQTATANTIWHQDLNKARQEAQELKRPILIHFGATWCGPCVKMERTVLNQPHVIDQLKANVICVKVDVDQNRALASRFGVGSFPMDIFLEPDGQRLMEATGYHPAEEYVDLVQKASRRYSTLLASRQPKSPANAVQSENVAGSTIPHHANNNGEPLLEGYCPVQLSKTRTWVKGKPEFIAEYKSQKFVFADAQSREEFNSTPDKYAPQFLGCDPVLLLTADRATAGSVEWAAFYEQRLYLFSNDQNRKDFKANPQRYMRTSVALEISDIERIFQ